MLREAHADAAAMVQRHPGGTRGAIEQRIEEWPVGHRIRAVLHGLRLAVRACDRTGIEMIAADHDGSFQFAFGDHLVEGEAEAVTVAKADPADACRQALELDAFL